MLTEGGNYISYTYQGVCQLSSEENLPMPHLLCSRSANTVAPACGT